MRCTSSGGYQGLPCGDPEWIEEPVAEVVSSLEDCLGQKGGEPPQMIEEPEPIDVWPLRSKTPRRGRRDTSVERSLTEAREAHCRAPATMASLKEEIDSLSQSVTRGQLEAHAHSRSWNHHRWRSRGWKRRCHQVQPGESHAPYFKYHPPWRGLESKEDEELPWISTWKLHWSWDWRLTASSRDQLKAWGRMSSPEPLVEELESWVTWRTWTHDMPG